MRLRFLRRGNGDVPAEGGAGATDSRVASFLRFPLIALIAFIHVTVAPPLPPEGFAAARGVIALVQDVLARVAVPLFFFFSGYFYFRGEEKFGRAEWLAKTRSRVKTLLIPYLVWNGLAAAQFFLRWKFSPEGAAGTPADFFAWATELRGGNAADAVGGAHPIFGAVLLTFAGTPLAGEFFPRPLVGQFWFVRDLFLVGLLSPLWFALLKKNFSAAALLLCSGAAWMVFGDEIRVNAQFMTPGIFFFCAGAFFAVRGLSFSAAASRLRVPATAIYAALAFADWRWEALGLPASGAAHACVHDLGILAGMIAATAWTAAGVRAGTLAPNRFLTASVFFVFGMHAVASRIFEASLLPLFPRDSSAWILCAFFAFAAFSLGFSLAAFALLSRFAPRLLVPLAGGRGAGKFGVPAPSEKN